MPPSPVGQIGNIPIPGGASDIIGNLLTRGGLIFVGGIVALVALWQLLSNTGAVPSPKDTVKAVGRAGATALAA